MLLSRQSVFVERFAPDHLALAGFLVVGGVSALAYALLVQGVAHLAPALDIWFVCALCYACCIGPTYLAHRQFAFASSALHLEAMPRYVAVQALSVCLVAFFSFVVAQVLGSVTVFTSLIAVGMTAGVSFVIMRKWVFAE